MKQHSLQLPDQVIGYVVIHRPRVTRRIHLEIDSAGALQVVAPKRMSRRAIHRALQEKAGHVARFLHDARARQGELPGYAYASGEAHLFLGEKRTLRVQHRPGKRAQVSGDEGEILVQSADPAPQQVKKHLAGWYRRQADQLFRQRLEYFSALAEWTASQAPPMRLRIMKKTWGSCSSRGVITLNPHLVKAPPECIDYVVAHEICHLREHNHSRAFYALQEQLYPRWRQAKAQLREQGHIYLHS